MWTFLLTMAVIGIASYAGYRFNMYLYERGALGVNARTMRSTDEESYPVRQTQETSLVRVQDYGLRYARTGILIFAILMLAIVLCLIALITSL